MNDFDEYLPQGEPDQHARDSAWKTAIGLQEVDGLKPSAYLLETAHKHIKGDITMDEVQHLIQSYYASSDARHAGRQGTEEADKVSANITQLLSERAFAFTPAGLMAIHRRLFDGVFPFAGQLRQANLEKKEWVLCGDTVNYVSAADVQRAMEYDLDREKDFDYSGLDMNGIVRHLTSFVSGIWQIHPFREGNTRATAVFTIQYLRFLGFQAENTLFAQHSWYFRNALVRANYQNIQKGVKREPIYLERFFRNLLMGETHELKNRFLLIQAPEALAEATRASTRASTRTSTVNQGQTDNENIMRLVEAIAGNQLSVREMMNATGLKHRENFMQYSLRPALSEGFVAMLYPDKPRHPRQKYLLTLKGQALCRSRSH